MKKRNKIIIISLSSFFLLVLITVIHIILVVDTSPVENGNIQLTRVDLKEDINENEGRPIQTYLRNIEGVTQTVLNTTDNNIVIGFDNNVTSIAKIGEDLNNRYPDKTTMYIPTAAEMAGTCPVINRNTTTYKMIASIKNIL